MFKLIINMSLFWKLEKNCALKINNSIASEY